MQTFLHGRDMIGDLDFTKEEVETVLDVAFDLKRKRALNEPHPYLRDKVLAMLFFFSSKTFSYFSAFNRDQTIEKLNLLNVENFCRRYFRLPMVYSYLKK